MKAGGGKAKPFRFSNKEVTESPKDFPKNQENDAEGWVKLRIAKHSRIPKRIKRRMRNDCPLAVWRSKPQHRRVRNERKRENCYGQGKSNNPKN